MSVPSRLLAEAEKQISNPFLLCALISKLTHRLATGENASSNTSEVMNYALNELSEGALEFEIAGQIRATSIPAQTDDKEDHSEFLSHEQPMPSPDTLPVEEA